jgi:hypothetical protein
VNTRYKDVGERGAKQEIKSKTTKRKNKENKNQNLKPETIDRSN